MATALAGVVLGMAAMVGFAETGDAKRFGQRLAHSTAVLSALRSEPPAGPIRKALTRAVSVDDVAEVPGQYRITPKRQALLNTIRFAEGTWLEGSNRGYQILLRGWDVSGPEPPSRAGGGEALYQHRCKCVSVSSGHMECRCPVAEPVQL